MIEADKTGRRWMLVKLDTGEIVERNAVLVKARIEGEAHGTVVLGGWPPHNVHVRSVAGAVHIGEPRGVHPRSLGCMWLRLQET